MASPMGIDYAVQNLVGVMDDPLADTLEYHYLLHPTTIKLVSRMADSTENHTAPVGSQIYANEQYMSSDEALSLSPNADDQSPSDDEECYDIGDTDGLDDILEGENSTSFNNRSRSNSSDSSSLVVLETAVAAAIPCVVHTGRATLIDITSRQQSHIKDDTAAPSTTISRQASTISTASESQYALSRPASTFSTAPSSVQMASPDTSPEIKQEFAPPPVPLRSRPPMHLGTKTAITAGNAKKDMLIDVSKIVPAFNYPRAGPAAKKTPTSILPTTPVTPTKSNSFFDKMGSKLKGKKEKPMQISTPYNFVKQPLTGPMLAANNGFPASTIVTDLDGSRSNTPSVSSTLMMSVTKLQHDESVTTKQQKRRGSVNILARTSSSASTASTRPKMTARGASERQGLSDIIDALNADEDLFKKEIAESAVSFPSMSPLAVRRKPVPSALSRVMINNQLHPERKASLA